MGYATAFFLILSGVDALGLKGQIAESIRSQPLLDENHSLSVNLLT